MVVPAAIEELKPEQQFDVFGRARWVFKRLVWTSAVLLILSGIVTTRRHWRRIQDEPVPSPSASREPATSRRRSSAARVGGGRRTRAPARWRC
jgi:hypothetical protein